MGVMSTQKRGARTGHLASTAYCEQSETMYVAEGTSALTPVLTDKAFADKTFAELSAVELNCPNSQRWRHLQGKLSVLS